ncbi:Ltp family lipoprotein, partial [Lacticaseibacillus paracasei]|uniref:Ltp family lipoprotein n=1 Tax=Lacticaseibacillus paracasei TaxID=1597 RepID=UPI004045BE8B
DGMLCKHHFSKNGQVFFHIFWVVTLIMQSRLITFFLIGNYSTETHYSYSSDKKIDSKINKAADDAIKNDTESNKAESQSREYAEDKSSRQDEEESKKEESQSRQNKQLESENASASARDASESRSREAESSESESHANQQVNVPIEYKSALKSAKKYLEFMPFSKRGLYDQLTSEYGGQFNGEASTYAVEHLNVNYNDNALQAAKTYQKEMSMSPAAIHDQLTSDYGGKFTQSEADYAIANLSK